MQTSVHSSPSRLHVMSQGTLPKDKATIIPIKAICSTNNKRNARWVEKMQVEVDNYYSKILLKIMASNNAQENRLCLYFMMAQLL